MEHIFSQSLGGQRVCRNVCDSCNLYFGSKQSGLVSIEVALKEPLNISKFFILSQLKENKLGRFRSEYFEYDLKRQIIRPKYKYSLLSGFQNSFTRQFKKGIYKIFLEERSESVGDAFDAQFDFIREFSRYGIGDYPVFYCQPRIPAVFVSNDMKEPVIRFTEHSERVMRQYGFYSYEFMSHNLAFPVIRAYELAMENYISSIIDGERPLYSRIIPLKFVTDLDFTYSFAFSNRSRS